VGRRALGFEVVNEVVAEFVSNGSQHRCVTEANLPVLRDGTPAVGLPSDDAFLAVGVDDHGTRRPTLTGIGPATSVEGKVRHRHTEALCHRPNEGRGLTPVNGVAVTEVGDERVVTAEPLHTMFVARYSIRSLHGSEVHIITPSVPTLLRSGCLQHNGCREPVALLVTRWFAGQRLRCFRRLEHLFILLAEVEFVDPGPAILNLAR